MRDLVFISHANPEQNDLASWLALKLASSGYRVWCDLVDLLGGEDFWDDIEEAIRTETVKFLWISSRAANDPDRGSRAELALATTVARQLKFADFVIPLRGDDLPFTEFNIEVHRKNGIDFRSRWADGLARLLEKLSRDGVPRDERIGPNLVRDWWRTRHDVDTGVTMEPQLYGSNWFRMEQLPQYIYFHKLSRSGPGRVDFDRALPQPSFSWAGHIVTFAPEKDFDGADLSPASGIARTSRHSTEEFSSVEWGHSQLRPSDRRRFLTRLLRDAWERWLTSRGLIPHDLASFTCHFFPLGGNEGDWVSYTDLDGTQRRKKLVGTSRRGVGERAITSYWHLALSAKPLLYPLRAYSVASHILFSDDGRVPWASSLRLHRKRRSFCKRWYNNQWRELNLAGVSWLAGGASLFAVPVSSEASVLVRSQPEFFESPVRVVPLTEATPGPQSEEVDALEEH